jgi:hypothetical protein
MSARMDILRVSCQFQRLQPARGAREARSRRRSHTIPVPIPTPGDLLCPICLQQLQEVVEITGFPGVLACTWTSRVSKLQHRFPLFERGE